MTIAGWGYDPYGDPIELIAPLTAPDDTGFQVIFAGSPDPEVYGGARRRGRARGVQPVGRGVRLRRRDRARAAPPRNGGGAVATRNHEPKAKAPTDRTMPLRTPFKLTGSGKDGDGDKLTYLWEQNDVGGAEGTKLVANKKVNGPLFRVFGTRAKVTNRGTLLSPSPNLNNADGNPTRYFPDLDQVLTGNTNARTGKLPEGRRRCRTTWTTTCRPKGKVVDCYSEFLPVKGYMGRPERQGPVDALPGHRPRRLRGRRRRRLPPTSPSSSTRAPGRSW